jgi:hypothetical protein
VEFIVIVSKRTSAIHKMEILYVASRTRSQPLPVLYSSTHEKVEFRQDDAIWSHFGLRE